MYGNILTIVLHNYWKVLHNSQTSNFGNNTWFSDNLKITVRKNPSVSCSAWTSGSSSFDAHYSDMIHKKQEGRPGYLKENLYLIWAGKQKSWLVPLKIFFKFNQWKLPEGFHVIIHPVCCWVISNGRNIIVVIKVILRKWHHRVIKLFNTLAFIHKDLFRWGIKRTTFWSAKVIRF